MAHLMPNAMRDTMRDTMRRAMQAVVPALLASLTLLAPLAPRAGAQTPSVSGPPMELDVATRRRLYAAMAEDLKQLVTAQERWFADHAEYAKTFERGAVRGVRITPSPGVTLTLVYVTKNAWAARATHDWLAGRSCVLIVGAVPASRRPATTDERKSPAREGVAVCDSR